YPKVPQVIMRKIIDRLCVQHLSMLLMIIFSCREEKSIDNLLAQAVKLDSLGYYSEAIKMYDSIINIDSLNIDAYLNRGVDKSISGDKVGAIMDFQKIV